MIPLGEKQSWLFVRHRKKTGFYREASGIDRA